ncbi:MAG: peptidoglycan DD-metalloendopeptidase family protein [Gammaproteobacteria bacterium]
MPTMIFPRKTTWFYMICLALTWCSTAAWGDELPRHQPTPGGVAVVALPTFPKTASAFYNDRRVLVTNQKDNWIALIGIPLSAKAGKHELELRQPGRPVQRIPFTVTHKSYEEQHLTIENKRMVNPQKRDLERIGKERVRIVKALAQWSERRDVPLRFDLPVDGVQSSPFGLRRFFNEQPRRPHSGLDIAAPEGTPIRVPAPGIVIDTGNFYFNGNTVFVDHGQGLVTMYCHMNSIIVTPGKRLPNGAIIGTVGETGRVTGPHLHWSVSLNNTRVDPSLFLSSSAKLRLKEY